MSQSKSVTSLFHFTLKVSLKYLKRCKWTKNHINLSPPITFVIYTFPFFFPQLRFGLFKTGDLVSNQFRKTIEFASLLAMIVVMVMRMMMMMTTMTTMKMTVTMTTALEKNQNLRKLFNALPRVQREHIWEVDLGDGQFSEQRDVDGSFFNSDAIPIIFWKSLTSPSSRLFSLTIGNNNFSIILLILGPIILGLLFKGF